MAKFRVPIQMTESKFRTSSAL